MSRWLPVVSQRAGGEEARGAGDANAVADLDAGRHLLSLGGKGAGLRSVASRAGPGTRPCCV